MNNGEFLKVMGGKIRAARKSKKMSLVALSKSAQIDLSNLCFLEQGRINCHILSLKAIADVLDVKVKDFF